MKMRYKLEGRYLSSSLQHTASVFNIKLVYIAMPYNSDRVFPLSVVSAILS